MTIRSVRKKRNFKIIYTTADIGLYITAKTIENVFEYAASGLFSIMYSNWEEINKQHPDKKQEKKIRLTNSNLPYLLIDWLNELIFIDETENFIPFAFFIHPITKISSWILDAKIKGTFRQAYLQKKIEVKAATYHKLELSKNKVGWQARIILDI